MQNDKIEAIQAAFDKFLKLHENCNVSQAMRFQYVNKSLENLYNIQDFQQAYESKMQDTSRITRNRMISQSTQRMSTSNLNLTKTPLLQKHLPATAVKKNKEWKSKLATLLKPNPRLVSAGRQLLDKDSSNPRFGSPEFGGYPERAQTAVQAKRPLSEFKIEDTDVKILGSSSTQKLLSVPFTRPTRTKVDFGESAHP